MSMFDKIRQSSIMKSIHDALNPRWEEIPHWLADQIATSSIMKGATHKYLRRVPTGKFSAKGRPLYRYFYKVTGGRGIGHHGEFVKDAAFKIHDQGQAGHFRIVHEHKNGTHVTIEHDETGKKMQIHKDALAAMLHREHAHEITQSVVENKGRKNRALDDLRVAHEHGTEKNVRTLEKEARKYGATEEEIEATKRKAEPEAEPEAEPKKAEPTTKEEEAPAEEAKTEKPAKKPRTKKPKKEKDDASSDKEPGAGGSGTEDVPDRPRVRRPDEPGAVDDHGADAAGEGAVRPEKEEPADASPEAKLPGEVNEGVPTEAGVDAIPPSVLAIMPDAEPEPAPTKPEDISLDQSAKSPIITLHADLLPDIRAIIPPEVKKFTNPDVKSGKLALMAHQMDDAARYMDATENGGGFLIQTDAGGGKSLSALAAIKSSMLLRGTKRHLYLVPVGNKDGLIGQIMKDAKLMGLDVLRGPPPDDQNAEGIWISSYDELPHTVEEADAKGVMRKREVDELHPGLRHKMDMLIMDEAHKLTKCSSLSSKGKASQRAKLALDLQGRSDKALYLSATPFTNVKDFRYLAKLGLYEPTYDSNGDENTSDSDQRFAEWAHESGAVVKKNKKGQVVEIRNPSDAFPMVSLAARMHVHGLSIKRIVSQEGLAVGFGTARMADLDRVHEKFPGHTLSAADAEKTYELANQMFGIMSQFAGKGKGMLKAHFINWSKAFWETLKTGHAIEGAEKELAEGRQVAIFTSYKDASKHSHLEGFAKQLRKRAELAGEAGAPQDIINDLLEGADQLSKLFAQVPKPPNPVEAISDYFKSKGESIAQVYGTKSGPKEQEKFQSGAARILVATIDKGGTGMSFHDDRGIAPRTQINMSLPWTAAGYVQLSGRTHRLGSRSNTRMVFLTGDADTETKAAATVANRARTMGALVSGDEGMACGIDDLIAAEYGVEPDPDEALGNLHEGGEEGGGDEEAAPQGGKKGGKKDKDDWSDYKRGQKSWEDKNPAPRRQEMSPEVAANVAAAKAKFHETAEAGRKFHRETMEAEYGGENTIARVARDRDKRKEIEVRRLSAGLRDQDIYVDQIEPGKFVLHGDKLTEKARKAKSSKYQQLKKNFPHLHMNTRGEVGGFKNVDELLAVGTALKAYDEGRAPMSADTAYHPTEAHRNAVAAGLTPEHEAKLEDLGHNVERHASSEKPNGLTPSSHSGYPSYESREAVHDAVRKFPAHRMSHLDTEAVDSPESLGKAIDLAHAQLKTGKAPSYEERQADVAKRKVSTYEGYLNKLGLSDEHKKTLKEHSLTIRDQSDSWGDGEQRPQIVSEHPDHITRGIHQKILTEHTEPGGYSRTHRGKNADGQLRAHAAIEAVGKTDIGEHIAAAKKLQDEQVAAEKARRDAAEAEHAKKQKVWTDTGLHSGGALESKAHSLGLAFSKYETSRGYAQDTVMVHQSEQTKKYAEQLQLAGGVYRYGRGFEMTPEAFAAALNNINKGSSYRAFVARLLKRDAA